MSELEILLSKIISDTREAFIQQGYSVALAQTQKKRLEDAIRNQQKLKNQEALLMAEFYALLKQHGYVYLNDDYENLIYLKNQLQIAIQPIQPVEVGSPHKPSKWDLLHSNTCNKKVTPVDHDVITRLSKALQYDSKKTTIKNASYYFEHVNVWIETLEKQEKIAGRETLKQLLSILGQSFSFNQEAFIQALLVLFQVSQPQKESDSKLDRYQLLLSKKLELLTTDELKKINKVMNTTTMISLCNAFYAVGCIGLESVDSSEWEKEAYLDAVKVWKTHQRQMEWEVLNNYPTLIHQPNALSDMALRNIGHAALSINEILAVTRDSVKTILQKRQTTTSQTKERVKKSRAVLRHNASEHMQPIWPTQGVFLQSNQQLSYSSVKIEIGEKENQSIGKLLKAYGNLESNKKSLLSQAQKQDNAFVNVMTTLNTLFFNPNQFIDLMASLKPEKIQWLVAQGTDKEVKQLYRALQTTEVNQLILLLNRIKKEDTAFKPSFYQHLGISQESAGSTWRWESLQIMTRELCQSIDMLTDRVKNELEKTAAIPLKEYPYKMALEQNKENKKIDSSWSTVKNTACMKQYLQRYIKGYEQSIKRSFIEKCYDWIYPADRNIKPKQLSLASPMVHGKNEEFWSEELNLEDNRNSIIDFSQLEALTPGMTPVLVMEE